MYAITQDFLDAMRADRRRADALVEVSYTDPFIDQNISVAASEQANVSYPQQTTDAVTQTILTSGPASTAPGSWTAPTTLLPGRRIWRGTSSAGGRRNSPTRTGR